MKLRALLAVLAGTSSAFAADLPALRVRPQTIDPKIQIGYGLAVADVDGDGKADILLADAKQIVWYRNPTWEKFVMAENLTPKDNVCIAARDLDGDGKCEVAVGAEWNPGDTVNSGAIFLLEAPADRTQRWTPVRLPHEPTTHRMHWMQRRNQKWFLAVLPLHGRGNKNNAGEGVKFLGYDWPWKESNQPFSIFDETTAVHATHNFEVVRFPEALVATQEGIKRITIHDSDWNHSLVGPVTTAPAGEVRAGRAPDRSKFTVTIEPMHGNQLVHYGSDILHTSKRTVLDESLLQGHALATGDLLGVGSDQIVVGWRGNKPGDKVGLKLYAATKPDGSAWTMHALIDDNTMACEDLKLADLNGDGRLDVIAAGRATKNVVIYWNETGAK
ncbi:MAG: VCBS repeat-containing protein [Verrucomicrobia bacterium]|nr:VCBS repeat-containing protein [Verrucomicrobiota bacterium]